MVQILSFLRQGGEGEVIDEFQTKRHATFTCAHCNTIHVVPVHCRPEDLGGLCKICMGLTCPKCTGNACDPFEEKLKRMEASYEARRSYGI